MSINFSQEYTVPSTGLTSSKTVTVDLIKSRNDSEANPVENTFITVAVSGEDTYKKAIEDILRDGLDAKRMAKPSACAYQGRVGTAYVSLTTLSLQTGQGANFAAKDVICVTDGTNTEYRCIERMSTDDIIMSSALDNAYAKNVTLVQKLARYETPLSADGYLGAKAQLEQPSAPTTPVATGGSGTITGIGCTCTETISTHFDYYIRTTATFTPTIYDYPDLVNQTAKSGLTVSTYNGGITITAGTYYLFVVAKDATGLSSNMSAPSVASSAITVS